jgi:hypothetical protein
MKTMIIKCLWGLLLVFPILGHAEGYPENTENRFPMSIRLQGKIVKSGDDTDLSHVYLHYGYGGRITVSDYQRTAFGLRLSYRSEENTVHGLEMPTIASRWEVTQPDGDGHFTTGWITVERSDEPPQLLAAEYRQEGYRIAALEVPLPGDLKPGSTVSAGEITLRETCAVEIIPELPETALPLSLTAGLQSVESDEKEKESIALHLALLNRLDQRLSLFAFQRGNYPLRHGQSTRIAGLPAFKKMDIFIVGPVPGIKAEYSVTLEPGKTVPLRLTGRDILGDPVRTVPMTGVVRFGGTGKPAAGAKIVISSYPDRFETETGKDGTFAIPAVKTGRDAVVFIDAPLPGTPPPFDHVTVTKRIRVPGNIDRFNETFEIPGMVLDTARISLPQASQAKGMRVKGLEDNDEPIPYEFAACIFGFDQDDLEYNFCPVISGQVHVGSGQYEWKNIMVRNIVLHSEDGTVSAQVRVPQFGNWSFYIAYTPFVYGSYNIDVTDNLIVDVYFVPFDNFVSRQAIQVLDVEGDPVPDGTEIVFPSLMPDTSPYSLLTKDGWVIPCCININPILVYVQSDCGCYDGEFTISFEWNVTLQLEECE